VRKTSGQAVASIAAAPVRRLQRAARPAWPGPWQ